MSCIRKTREEFIGEAIKIHGNKYNYSLVEYNGNNVKVKIICNKCKNVFEQTPAIHLSGNGCSFCKTFPKRITNEEYINFFNENYPTLELLSDYNGNKNYITVRCKIHDYIFNTKPNWLKKGNGCKKCYDDRRGKTLKKTKEQFIEESIKIHGNKYDYSKVEYINSKQKVCIVCPIHGEFWQTPNKHLCGNSCPKCANEINGFNKRMGDNEFIKRAKEIHGNKYDYSKVKYIDIDTKVCITCPIHGEFYQTPYIHLNGCGCSLCNVSHLENNVKHILESNNIEFEYQKKFKWLGRQSLDFYLPKYNIAIECQGEQHFKEVEYFNGNDGFIKRKELDIKKYNICIDNNVNILYLVNNEIKIDDDLKNIYKSLYTIEGFKEKIKNILNE